jgi:hypothetical protein
MRTLLSFLLIALASACYGQIAEPKFGVIDPAELSMNRYEKDTTADAVVLFDNGTTNFNLNSEGSFQTIFERHTRIKIFRKAAFNLANIEISLYKNNSGREKLTNLKASTYNLVDGKLVKTKVEKSIIFDEETKNYVTTKFAFPEVKEGSIIELEYAITSDFLYNLRGWQFQYKYPALWSQYTYTIPEYFNYRTNSRGYLTFQVNTKKNNIATYVLRYTNEIQVGLVSGTRNGNRTEFYNVKAKTINCTLATRDVPAFISEPDIDCEDNYIQSIEFELISVQYPEQPVKDFTQTWESVNKQMIGDENFGSLLKSKGFINDTVALLCKDKISDIDKASAIYSYVQKRMKWNGRYSIWALNGLSKPYKARTGNSCEINLLLTLMLQTAGLDANPVIFSTRDNGLGISFYPTITKYNSVLTKLKSGDNTYLLDATSLLCPMGMLPANDINVKGREVNNKGGGWVDLDTKVYYNEVKWYTLKLLPDGKFTGFIKGNYDGYAGYEYRKYLEIEKSDEDYIRKLQENIKGLNINGYSIINKNNIYSPLGDSLNVEITDRSEILGDKIIFLPLLFETIERNRYTLEDRKYPVNMNYPISETYIFDYTLPEGYQIESVPKSVVLRFPGNSMTISYSIQNTENKINMIYKRYITKTLFLPDEYANLKELYNQMVKKHNENIILKRKSL